VSLVRCDQFCWEHVQGTGNSAVVHIRNSAIGTLLVDLSEGKELDAAVGAFEAKVAPANYKRPNALITQSMIKKAQRVVEDLGFLDALERRHANIEDITVNNVIFADRDARQAMSGQNVFDELNDTVAVNLKLLSKVEEIDIDTFIKDVIPNIDSVEVLLENNHSGNLMSLIAPIHPESNNMLLWDNNFSWTYNGDITDSMKKRVKAAGGDVTGIIRYSIQWNVGPDYNRNDFDAHCIEPGGNLIYFSRMTNMRTSGKLDVDIIHPINGTPAVENITWSQEDKMETGTYRFIVHNYSHNGGRSGFTAEIEYNGEIRSYEYNKELRNGQKVEVADIYFEPFKEFKVVSELPSTVASREIWGINTMQFQRVSMIMNSPNHWDHHKIGNKHVFFILEGCKQPGNARGFYNEFISNQLRDHRKVFEVLGSKMKAQESNDQLSGLGFSSTQRNHVYCQVNGSFTRTLKITF